MRPLVPAPTLNQRPPPWSTSTSTSTARSTWPSTLPTAWAAARSSAWIASRISRVLRRSRSSVASRTASVRSSSDIPRLFGRPPGSVDSDAYTRRVPFQVSHRTLERLEWPDLVARLVRGLATPRGRARAGDPAALFAESAAEARRALAETGEARALAAAGAAPPLGGVPELDLALARLAKGGALGSAELLAVGSAARAVSETARSLARRSDEAPLLAGRAAALADPGPLADSIAAALEP